MEKEETNQSQDNTFTDKIVTILNNAMTGIMISIGHKTHLFDTLAKLPPSTLPEIIQSTGLHQRYLLEWLCTMVVSGIIDYNTDSKKFSFPQEHAQVISRQAGYKNLASYTQWISPLASVEDKVVECFKHGGGVGYEYYTDFLELLSVNANLKYTALLANKILPSIPEIHDNLMNGIDVLDVGCGYGDAALIIASSYPKSKITGIDISEQCILKATAEAKKLLLNNVSFQIKKIENLSTDKKYNLISAFDFIHDTAQPYNVLESIFDALVDDGIFLMVDIKASSNIEDNLDHPMAPLLYAVSTLHCMTVSLAENGIGLGTMWGEEKALELLKKVGFKSVDVFKIEADSFNSYFVAKK